MIADNHFREISLIYDLLIYDLLIYDLLIYDLRFVTFPLPSMNYSLQTIHYYRIPRIFRALA